MLRGQRQNQDKYTCPQAPDGSLTGKHVIPGPGYSKGKRQRHPIFDPLGSKISDPFAVSY